MSRHALNAWRLTEWSRRAPRDIDGKAGRPSERVKRLYRFRSLETTAKVIAASGVSGEALYKN